MRWSIVAVGVVGLLALAPRGLASAQLSLTISSPRVEEAPITFTASGTARPADSRGESQDFLQGAVVPHRSSCPSGPDEFGNIPGSVLNTFKDFPTGPFDVTYKFDPSEDDLVAGRYLDCVYLVDRLSDTARESAQEPFVVRKAHAQVRLLHVPRHWRFGYDIVGHPSASATFLVRASVEAPGRELRIGIEWPGERRPCTGDLRYAYGGGTYTDEHPLRAGAARNYRIPVLLSMPVGPPPYGRRVRVCTMVTYYDASDDSYLLEGLSQIAMLLRR